jgi:hypothetical protein
MSSTTITRESAATAMQQVGLGSYTSYAGIAADLVNAGRSASDIAGYAASRGVRIDTRTVEDFLAAVSSEPVAEQAEGFDREHAVNVLRNYAASKGANSDEVEGVLVEAGLVDPEPEPEPEAEVASEGGLADIARRIEASVNALTAKVESLTTFARRNGYRD